MSSSTNKSIADREANKSHHEPDEHRVADDSNRETFSIEEETRKQHTRISERGRHVEREVTNEPKK